MKIEIRVYVYKKCDGKYFIFARYKNFEHDETDKKHHHMKEYIPRIEIQHVNIDLIIKQTYTNLILWCFSPRCDVGWLSRDLLDDDDITKQSRQIAILSLSSAPKVSLNIRWKSTCHWCLPSHFQVTQNLFPLSLSPC